MKEDEVGRRRWLGLTRNSLTGLHDLEDAVWLTFSLPDDSSSGSRNGLVKLSWEGRKRQTGS